MPIVRHSRRTWADLRGIWEYVALENHSPIAADNFIRNLYKKLETLAHFPRMGTAHPEIGPNIRIFPVDAYVIQYEPLPDGIKVMRVVHGARER